MAIPPPRPLCNHCRMDQVWGVGVLGLGVQGAAVARELDAHPRLRVAATYDPVPPVGHGFRMRADAHAVIDAHEVDVVYIATPPALHVEAAIAAAAAGKAVFCEKPLAPDAAGAERIVTAAATAGVPGAVNFYLATNAAGRAVTAAVRAGRIGPVHHMRLCARFRQWPRPWQSGAGSWLVGTVEGGFTREVVSHYLFLADRLVGPGVVDHAEVTRDGAGCETALTAVLSHGVAAFEIDVMLGGEADEAIRLDIIGERGQLAIVGWDDVVGHDVQPAGSGGVGDALVALLDGAPTELPDLASGSRVAGLVEAMLIPPREGKGCCAGSSS